VIPASPSTGLKSPSVPREKSEGSARDDGEGHLPWTFFLAKYATFSSDIVMSMSST